MSALDKEQLEKIIEYYDLKKGEEVHGALKDMFKGVIEKMLEAELDEELGYKKHQSVQKKTSNSRNGRSQKKVSTDLGTFELDIPRDRENTFEPQVVKKGQKDLAGLDKKVLALYGHGMSTREISAHIKELYGANVSADTVSRITDKILPTIKEWQSRPLKPVYPILYLDGLNVRVKQNGTYQMKCAHIVMGVDLDGFKDILGIWIGESESAKFWLYVLNELKNRGVEDVFIAAVDGLTGFKEAIEAAYPKTEVQRCIVHQIRNSCRFVSSKDRKAFCAGLKEIYSAPSEDAGLEALARFDEEWGEKYRYAVKSWYANWENLATLFKYPPVIRRLIYTTNPIESANRVYRRHTKTRTQFPSDESAMKVLYLATEKIVLKWGKRVHNWGEILGQFTVMFDERIERFL